MNRYRQIFTGIALAFLCSLTLIATAQKNNNNNSTNTLSGSDNGSNNAYSINGHDGITITTSQSDRGLHIPKGLIQDAGDIYNTTSTNDGPSGGNASNTSSSNCPLMYVDVDIPFLQSCIQSTSRISYCNHGTAAAQNVYVDLTLDSVLVLDSSNVAYAALGGNAYRFQLGTVADSACGGFDIYFTTACDTSLLNEEHCIDAHIYPDTACTGVVGQFLVGTNATCNGHTINFGLQNYGPPITTSQQVRFVIIDDHLIFGGNPTIVQQGSVVLQSGQSMQITLNNPTGNDYRMELLDANDDLIAGSVINNCMATNGNVHVSNYSGQSFWNNSNLPATDQGCATNGDAPVDARGTNTPSSGGSLVDNVGEDAAAVITAYPNPFQQSTTIKIEGDIADNYYFNLYDVTGRLLRKKAITRTNTFQVNRNSLKAGVYFYRIEALGKIIGSGKLIVQ